MKKWILASYIQPNSQTYIFFYYLHRYLWGILFAIIFFILAYPLFKLTQLNFLIEKQQQQTAELSEEITQSNKLLASLQQHQQQQHQAKPEFSEINQQIQQLLKRHQVKVENLQWQLDQQPSLYLTINHQSKILFHLIQEINNIKSLAIQAISLTKLHENRLVQLHAVLTFTNKETP